MHCGGQLITNTMMKNTSSETTTTAAADTSWTARIRKRPPSLVFEGLGTDHVWYTTSPTTTSTITVTNTSIPVLSSHGGNGNYGSSQTHHHPSVLRRVDSAMNSLECWDYSVELECLQGSDGNVDVLVYNLFFIIARFLNE